MRSLSHSEHHTNVKISRRDSKKPSQVTHNAIYPFSMGASPSVELQVAEEAFSLGSFRGTLTLRNRRQRRGVHLERAARVTMQLRNTMKTPHKKYTEVNIQSVWNVGGEVVPAGTRLEAGEVKVIEFDFDLENKVTDMTTKGLESPSSWAQRFGSFSYMKYELVVRGGSPPQTKDIVLYFPQLLPEEARGVQKGAVAGGPEAVDVLHLAANGIADLF